MAAKGSDAMDRRRCFFWPPMLFSRIEATMKTQPAQRCSCRRSPIRSNVTAQDLRGWTRWWRIALLFAGTLVVGRTWAYEPEEGRALLIGPAVQGQLDSPIWLLPPADQRITGNAVVYYGKAATAWGAYSAVNARTIAIRTAASRPIEQIISDITLPDAVEHPLALKNLDQAARCTYAAWQLPLRGEPQLKRSLPKLSELQFLGALLNARIRMKAAQGDFDASLKSAQSCFALARNLGKEPTPASIMTALAIEEQTLDALIDFVQQKNAPNIYCGLSALPSPLIDEMPAIQMLVSTLDQSFPWLDEIESEEGGIDEWNRRLTEFWDTMKRANVYPGWATGSSIEANIVLGYPIAKRRLLRSGYKRSFLERIPVSQALLSMRTTRVGSTAMRLPTLRCSRFLWRMLSCGKRNRVWRIKTSSGSSMWRLVPASEWLTSVYLQCMSSRN